MLTWTLSSGRASSTAALWQRPCKFRSVVRRSYPRHLNDAGRCRRRFLRITMNRQAPERFFPSSGSADGRNDDAADSAGSLPRAAAHDRNSGLQRPVGRIPFRPITVSVFKVLPPGETASRSCRADRRSRCGPHATDPVSITPCHANLGQACRHHRLAVCGQIFRMLDRRATAARQQPANTMSRACRQAPPRSREARETMPIGPPRANAGGGVRANAAAENGDAPDTRNRPSPRPRRVHPGSGHGCGKRYPAGRQVSYTSHIVSGTVPSSGSIRSH